jgi:potassium-dependent mechanosensitive channel
MDAWGQTLFTINDTPVSGGSILACLLILIVSFALAKWAKRYVSKSSFLEQQIGSSTLYGVGRLLYYVILVIGIYVALTTIGIDLTGITIVISALGVGVGFGLQSIFNNFVAGIIVLLEKKVCINDTVQLDSGEVGVVSEINIRCTLIRTDDDREVIIPNTELVSKKVIKITPQA